MNLFILIGAPGTGKTWLCDKLSNDFNISGNQSYLINRLEYEALKLKLQLPQDKSMVILNPQQQLV